MRWILPFVLASALSAATADTVGDMNRFAVESYRELASGTGGNLVFSPFTTWSALSMLSPGARGQTAVEIQKVLGKTAADLSGICALAGEITRSGNTGGNRLTTANSLWVQQGFGLQADFTDALRDQFHLAPMQLDFVRDLDRSRLRINEWTQEHTGGKILNLFGPGALHPDTRLVVASALYFHGIWESRFRTGNSHPGDFHLATGAAKATFMNQTAPFRYLETPAVQVLEMRYAGTSLAMDILLPKEGASLDRSLSPAELTEWFAGLQTRTVAVALPRFRSESAVSLRSMLTALGMATAFRESDADFSGIDGRRDLALSDVMHKCWIDVAEEGTEAAAATGAVVNLISTVVSQPTVFRADRPFVYILRDAHSGLILLMGRLANPLS